MDASKIKEDDWLVIRVRAKKCTPQGDKDNSKGWIVDDADNVYVDGGSNLHNQRTFWVNASNIIGVWEE